MTKSDKICPTCTGKHNQPYVLSNLIQRKYVMKTISRNGKVYDKHRFIKRAYYCEHCHTIYVDKDQTVIIKKIKLEVN